MYTEFWAEDLRERDHLEKTKRRWGDNIEMDFENVGWGSLEWPGVAQNVDGLQALSHLIFNFLCDGKSQIVQILSLLPNFVRTKL